MIFTYMENTALIKKIDKFIKIERNNQVSTENFVDELRTMNIYEKLNQNVNESQLPPYLDTMLPTLPNVCDNYNISLPTFNLPLIKHAFAEQRFDDQLLKILNVNRSQAVILKARALFFMALKPL